MKTKQYAVMFATQPYQNAYYVTQSFKTIEKFKHLSTIKETCKYSSIRTQGAEEINSYETARLKGTFYPTLYSLEEATRIMKKMKTQIKTFIYYPSNEVFLIKATKLDAYIELKNNSKNKH